MMHTTAAPRRSAILLGVQLPGVSDEEHAASLAELGRLVQTLGLDIDATVTQRRQSLAAGIVVGRGRLADIAQLTGGSGVVTSGAAKVRSKARDKWADDDGDDEMPEEPIESLSAVRPSVVVVDHEISPTQFRNLERATGAQVLDRTGVIVDIFHRHARSREARLQVEIARLNYVAPRLRESSGGSERQQGAGAGESALELDRRKIRDRIAELREGLAAIQKDSDNRRQARRDRLRVALVGYTNAGKSSLMRALTGSEVLVADKLFATLDTTVRALQPESRPRILISDTVGFIKKLPHDLVASFRSTLDEALEASLLLHVVDGADRTWESQREVTRAVLEEIGAGAVPTRLVFNKADLMDDAQRRELASRHPEAFFVSSRHPEDVAWLRAQLIAHFETSMVDEELFVPYASQGLLGEVYENARILSEEYGEGGRTMQVRGLPGALAQLRRSLAADATGRRS